MSEEKKPIVVGTYNMSFASDLGRAVGSEAKFLNRMKAEGGVVDRRYWKNALEHLKKFIEAKKPLAVGLQEMNLTQEKAQPEKTEKTEETEETEETKKIEQTGTFAVKEMLNSLEEEGLKDSYSTIEDQEIVTNDQKPALQIIYHKSLGDTPIKSKIYTNTNQDGRPILMAYFENNGKNTLLVNAHGAQDPSLGKFEKEFNDYMKEKNKKYLEEKIKKFLSEIEGSRPTEIYVMGDFNDRYDAIKEFNILLNDKEEEIKYDGDSPISCCHNFDSMGNEEVKEPIYQNKQQKADEDENKEMKKLRPTANSQFKQGKDDDQYKNENDTIPEKHGINIADYLNKGDKVFAWPNAGNLEIYTGSDTEHLNKPSDKSDHELVYMTIEDKTAAAEPEPTTEPTTTPTEPAPADTSEESATKVPADQAADKEPAPKSLLGGFFGGKKKTKKRKSSKKKTKKKRKGKRKGGTKKLNTTHKK